MKGDFSRFTFDPLKGYSRVLMQQGRVTLDADLNEQSAISLHLMRTLGADLIGEHGGPARNCAFRLISREDIASNLSEDDIARLENKNILPLAERDALFSPGHYYVDGLLVALQDYSSYTRQPFLPDPADLSGDVASLVYLDVWEHHVTMLEDDNIREVALGGPDTATRVQLVWQIKVLQGEEVDTFFEDEDNERTPCERFDLSRFRHTLQGNPPHLRARARGNAEGDDPCVMPADARYRGHENQLYRVEIHRVNKNAEEVTFKWSRENGSVVVPWLATKGNDLILSGIRDRARGFGAGDWVELSDDDHALRGEAGVLVQAVAVEGDILTVDPATASGTIDANPDVEKHAKVRRWDQRERKGLSLVEGAIPVGEASGDEGWMELEDGVQIQFQPPGDESQPTTYRTGDYWLIPARVATGDLIWPQEEVTDAAGNVSTRPSALEPYGIEHHHAPLWFVGDNGNGPVDLRRKFRALAQCTDRG